MCCCLLLLARQQAGSSNLEASRLHGRRVGTSGMARWTGRSAARARPGAGALMCLLSFYYG